MVAPTIIFEDAAILVIDKPYGVVVNRAETTKEETIQDWILQCHSEVTAGIGEFFEKSGIVHRLDKDTSGVLVIAKTPDTYEKLKAQFQNREVTKKYLALVHGKVEPPEGVINVPIERSPFNRMQFGVFPGGREAVTSYKVIKLLSSYSLLEISPHTGRTHQIRVHLKYLGHPIVSDPIYGGRKQLRLDLKFCPRLFLHATSLKIKHPTTGEILEFKSALPEKLQKVLN